MSDNHGGVTTAYAYTYNDVGLVETVTSPGNKVWTFGYNELGQPTVMQYPNGMVKLWEYDTRNRTDARLLGLCRRYLGKYLALRTCILRGLQVNSDKLSELRTWVTTAPPLWRVILSL